MAIPGINNAIAAVDLLLSTAAIDTVAILDGFDQVLYDARPIKASIRQPSRILDHPLENGQVISDYSVILPVEIDLMVIVPALNYRSVGQKIIQLFQTKQLLTIQLKEGNFVNMVIADIPREETTQLYDAFSMVIKFRQVLVVQAAPSFNPLDPTQVNIQPLGQQTATIALPIDPSSINPSSAIPLTGTDYSSVPNLSSTSYQITGVQTPNGAQTITNASPSIPVTGAQTITNSGSLSSVFGGISGGL